MIVYFDSKKERKKEKGNKERTLKEESKIEHEYIWKCYTQKKKMFKNNNVIAATSEPEDWMCVGNQREKSRTLALDTS